MSGSTENSSPSESIYIDKKTGKQTRLYRLGGKTCPRVTLNSPLAKRHSGYMLIKLDLNDSRSWLDAAHELLPRRPETQRAGRSVFRRTNGSIPFKTIKALWFAALVIYGKCYTQAEGRRLKLERSNLPERLRSHHDTIMSFRHTIVAHAGRTEYERADLQLVLDPRASRSVYWLREDVQRLDFVDDRADPETFTQLIDASLTYTQQKLEELESHIHEKELSKYPPEHWYSIASPKCA